MAVTVEDFASYVGEDYATSDRQTDLDNSVAVAEALLHQKLSKAWRQPDAAIYDQMVKDVAYAVYKRSENNGGQYESTDALRAPNDPLAPVNQILKMYVMSV